MNSLVAGAQRALEDDLARPSSRAGSRDTSPCRARRSGAPSAPRFGVRDDRRRRGRRVAAAELPGDDHERGQRRDPEEREQDDRPLDAALLPDPRPPLRHVVEAVGDDSGSCTRRRRAAPSRPRNSAYDRMNPLMYVPVGSTSNCSSSSARMYFARIFVASSTWRVVEPLAHARFTEAVADLEHSAGAL